MDAWRKSLSLSLALVSCKPNPKIWLNTEPWFLHSGLLDWPTVHNVFGILGSGETSDGHLQRDGDAVVHEYCVPALGHQRQPSGCELLQLPPQRHLQQRDGGEHDVPGVRAGLPQHGVGGVVDVGRQPEHLQPRVRPRCRCAQRPCAVPNRRPDGRARAHCGLQITIPGKKTDPSLPPYLPWTLEFFHSMPTFHFIQGPRPWNCVSPWTMESWNWILCGHGPTRPVGFNSWVWVKPNPSLPRHTLHHHGQGPWPWNCVEPWNPYEDRIMGSLNSVMLYHGLSIVVSCVLRHMRPSASNFEFGRTEP